MKLHKNNLTARQARLLVFSGIMQTQEITKARWEKLAWCWRKSKTSEFKPMLLLVADEWIKNSYDLLSHRLTDKTLAS